MLRFVGDRYQAPFTGNPCERLPCRWNPDFVDPPAPRIEGHQLRFVLSARKRELEQLAGRELTHLLQLGLDLGANLIRQRSLEVFAEQPIGVELIAERWTLLEEGHGDLHPGVYLGDVVSTWSRCVF